MDFSSLSTGELGLLVTMCGLIIVFIVLAILVACISAFGSVMQLGGKRKTEKTPPALENENDSKKAPAAPSGHARHHRWLFQGQSELPTNSDAAKCAARESGFTRFVNQA